MMDRVTVLRIEPISKTHNRDDFDCGEAVLNDYLRRHARQNHDDNIARAFVALDEDNRVLGYYCISTAEVAFADLPSEYTRRIPKYPVPAVRIGKFAVDKTIQGEGLADRLLIDALQRILSVAGGIGVNIVLVDALDENAKNFWLHYEFLELPGHENNLFLPLQTIAQLFR
jgi:GNAT superfamily N-acetyltransferase